MRLMLPRYNTHKDFQLVTRVLEISRLIRIILRSIDSSLRTLPAKEGAGYYSCGIGYFSSKQRISSFANYVSGMSNENV